VNSFQIAVIPGEGIGIEVTPTACGVLQAGRSLPRISIASDMVSLVLHVMAAHEEVVIADLANFERVMTFTDKVDCVIHMGGAVGPALSFEQVFKVTLIGLRNLYEGCRKNSVKRVIWAGSLQLK